MRNVLGSAVAAALLLFASVAHAQLFRAYLTADGNDANPCTLPQPCRLLEIQGFRGGFHVRGKLCLHRLAFAIQKALGLPHQLIIGGKLDVIHARRRAALDLVEQAGPCPFGINTVITRP